MSRLRTYLVIFALAALLPLVVTVAINATGFLVLRQTPGSDLFNDRLAKLDRSPTIDLVFLGDSSLGNSINEHLVSSLTGQRAANLALSGIWGYGGSLAMLERLLERQSPPTLILVHTADSFGRDDGDFGYFLASDQRRAVFLSDPEVRRTVWANLSSPKNVKRWYKAWRRGDVADVDPEIDYFHQKTSIRDQLFQATDLDLLMDKHLHMDAVNRANIKYLERIAALCQAYHMRCLYAHGPLALPFIGRARNFLDEVNPIIEQLDFELLAPSPMPLNYSEIGDSEDHPAPVVKDLVTRRFADLLLPRLPVHLPVAFGPVVRSRKWPDLPILSDHLDG